MKKLGLTLLGLVLAAWLAGQNINMQPSPAMHAGANKPNKMKDHEQAELLLLITNGVGKLAALGGATNYSDGETINVLTKKFGFHFTP